MGLHGLMQGQLYLFTQEYHKYVENIISDDDVTVVTEQSRRTFILNNRKSTEDTLRKFRQQRGHAVYDLFT
jgi:hypothetical protein